MTRRAVDLSLEELAVLGAEAAERAAQQSYDAGLAVTGTVDVREDGQAISRVVRRLPSGEVTLLHDIDTRNAQVAATKAVASHET